MTTYIGSVSNLSGGTLAIQMREGELFWFIQNQDVAPLTVAGSLPAPDPSTFVAQQRSLYVPADDVGYWQGAIRDGDTDRGDAVALREAIDAGRRLTLFLRYGDQDGGHDTVSRFTLSHDENGDWLFGVVRHWTL